MAGSGRVGRDMGLAFLCGGWDVDWLSRDAGRLAGLERQVRRVVKRQQRLFPKDELGAASFRNYGTPLAADLLLECVEESLTAKRLVFAQLVPGEGQGMLLVSASSSILPWEIHPRCMGLHPFYPLALTGLVELVAPQAHVPERLLDCLRALDLRILLQDEAAAFAVNRLLLPLQSELLRLLRAGAPAQLLDEASRSDLLGLGALELMDAVGLDVALAAVRQYRSRMTRAQAQACAPLEEGLAIGKRGRKNRDGLLCGRALPWAPAPGPWDQEALRRRLRGLLEDKARAMLASGQLDERGLALAGERVLQGNWS